MQNTQIFYRGPVMFVVTSFPKQYLFTSIFFFFFLIGIHSMQGWTTTARYGVTRKEAEKILQNTENLFRKNLKLKDIS